MTTETLSEKLTKLGYTLERVPSGWIVRGSGLTYNWYLSTLKEVHHFVVDEEATKASA